MKRFSIFFVLLALCVAALSAKDDDITIKRTVLKAAQEFDNIVVNGDITIDCRFHPDYTGLIVYHNTESNERLDCHNENNQLIIDGNHAKHKIMSRVVIFCSDSLNTIILNGSGKVLMRRTPLLDELQINLNGSGEIKAHTIKAQNIKIVNNSNGSIKIDKVQSQQLSIINNGEGDIDIMGGKTDNAELTVNNTGAINSGVHCNNVNPTINGSGELHYKGNDNK